MNRIEKIFINFIPTSSYCPEFYLKSIVQLNRLSMDPSLLVFEVVETEKAEVLPRLVNNFSLLQGTGVCVRVFAPTPHNRSLLPLSRDLFSILLSAIV